MLGGSSSLNFMLYVRGNKYNYDHWASIGNENWDYDSLSKYMKRMEGNRSPTIVSYDNGFYHSDDGPVNIDFFPREPRQQIILDAAQEVGNEQILDINADKTLGYFYHQGFVYKGLRQSAAKAYLIPAKNRPNLCIVKNAMVYKILFNEKKRAIGVKYDYKGIKNLTAYAKKEVILSAGTIESAKLLLLSGVGPKDQLDLFNISTIVNLPVGENFIDHVGVVLYFKFEKAPTPPTQSLDEIFDYFIHRKGALAGSHGVIGGFENSKNNRQYTYSDLQLLYGYSHIGPKTFLNNQSAVKEQNPCQKRSKEADIVFLRLKVNQPKSVGYIRLKSTSYKLQPFINASLLAHPSDMEMMMRGLKRQLKLLKTKSFKKVKAKLVRRPLAECDAFYRYKSDEYWRCYIRYLSSPMNHAVGMKRIYVKPLLSDLLETFFRSLTGTSKMAPRSDSGVVDNELRVYGVTGLRQADLGIAPFPPSANTHAPALIIGEKAADMIKKTYL